MSEVSTKRIRLINAAQIACHIDINTDSPYCWLNAFDEGELASFVTELIAVSDSELDNLVHEWHESAIALDNQELREAYGSD